MTGSRPLPVEIVREPGQLSTAARELSGSDAIALDTESNSFHHYPEQLCLIQIASRRKVYIIDTISLDELAPLKEVLADAAVKKVIHAADNDVRSIDRRCGLRIRNLFDTSIAARFAGITEISLAALIRNMLGITIDKSKRLQRADWGRRPLSAEAIEYAAGDVRHLFALRGILEQRLQALGRARWVEEECARIEDIRYTAPDQETAYLAIKGTRDLDGRGLAVLRSLVSFREEEARRQQRPPFFVLPDAALVFLAADPEADFSNMPGLGQTGLNRFGPELKQALRDGMTAPAASRPRAPRAERPGTEQLERLSGLKEWRKSLGANLALDPSLLWPLASLERLAKAPDTLSAEITSESIRHWQRETVVPSLQSYLSQLRLVRKATA